MVRVAVLGGGMSGCVLAAELSSGGCDVTLIERAPRLGGLHRTIAIGPYHFDIGAFVFGENHSVFQTFPGLMSTFPKVASQFGVIRHRGFIDSYPMSMSGLRKQYGVAFIARVIAEATLSKLQYRRQDSVSCWVKYFTGPTLYERSGLRRYIERLYLASDSEIDVTFAEKRMSRIAKSAGFRSVIGRAVRRITGRELLVPVLGPRTSPFVRVRSEGGFDSVYGRMGEELVRRGVDIQMSQSVQKITHDARTFTLHGLRDEEPFDAVFSTVPLGISARLLQLDNVTNPETVDVYSLFFETAAEPPFPHTVLHNFTETGQWKRMTMLSRYYGKKNGKHYFVIEGTSLPEADSDQVIADAKADFYEWLEREQIFSEPPVMLDGQVTKNGYPVYRTESAASLADLKARIEATGLHSVGRQGNFDYISSSDAARSARVAAAEFLEKNRERLGDAR